MNPVLPPLNDCTVAVVGLGYVGLPLAVEFGKPQVCCRTGAALKRRVIGFDINTKRLEELVQGIDRTNESTFEEIASAHMLEFTNDPAQLALADVFIVTVPTPIDNAKRPDLTPLVEASTAVGKALKTRAIKNGKKAAIVIFESTVYPGATEEICVPILEKESELVFNVDFCCGYSPERINPGDKEHKLTTITKVTSGSTDQASLWVDTFYGSVIKAGTHLAQSLKVAEAAKVIENTQRDLNIALVNELSIIFQKLDIDTLDVLDAASTKWNFIPFKPGLVGGHCIGIDPYYLTHKAEQVGYYPQVVLAGRRINDGMAELYATKVILSLAESGQPIAGAKVLVLGITFKENCPDIRNTKVIDLIKSLLKYKVTVEIVDPWVDQCSATKLYGVTVQNRIPKDKSFNAVLLVVAHQEFTQFSQDDWLNLLLVDGLLFDFKGIIPRELNPIRI